MQAGDAAFAWLVSWLKDRDFHVIGVPVKWERRTLTQQAASFADFFNERKGEENFVLGFSLGASITLMTARQLRPRRIALCSLGPDYKEDQATTIPAHVRFMGKRRFEDMATRSADDLARGLTMPCAVIFGAAEAAQFPALSVRGNAAVKWAENATLHIAPNAPHQFDFPTYVETVKHALADW